MYSWESGKSEENMISKVISGGRFSYPKKQKPDIDCDKAKQGGLSVCVNIYIAHQEGLHLLRLCPHD